MIGFIATNCEVFSMLTKCKTALARAGAFVSRPFRALWHLMRANQLQTNLWLLFAATPFICFLMVELLAENKMSSLAPWQWLMNIVWYTCLLFIGWLITGGRRGAIAFDSIFSFIIGLANHYVLQFRGRALFPIDLLSLGTAANVAGNYDYTPDGYVYGAAGILGLVILFLVLLPRERARWGGRRWVKWLNLGLSAGWCAYILIFFFTPMLPTLGIYAQQWWTNRNGFLLNFTVSARYMHVEKPDGYSEDKALELIARLEDEGYTSDSAIQELIEHYEQVEEPTVIFFFGDHQPPLSNDLYKDIYGKELDERSVDELLEQYVTPYFIWANFDIDEAEGVDTGSNFIGMQASLLAGYPQTGYMKFLARVNETFTGITPVGYVLKDGSAYEDRESLPEDARELLDQYEILQYYNLFGGDQAEEFFYVGE